MSEAYYPPAVANNGGVYVALTDTTAPREEFEPLARQLWTSTKPPVPWDALPLNGRQQRKWLTVARAMSDTQVVAAFYQAVANLADEYAARLDVQEDPDGYEAGVTHAAHCAAWDLNALLRKVGIR